MYCLLHNITYTTLQHVCLSIFNSKTVYSLTTGFTRFCFQIGSIDHRSIKLFMKSYRELNVIHDLLTNFMHTLFDDCCYCTHVSSSIFVLLQTLRILSRQRSGISLLQMQSVIGIESVFLGSINLVFEESIFQIQNF